MPIIGEAMEPRIPHSRPTLGKHEEAAVRRVLRSGRLSAGREVAAFEREVAAVTGTRGGVAVNSGSAALHLALLALDCGKGDDVVVPSYCCAALLNAVAYTGASAVIADVSPDTGLLTPETARRALTSRTRAIVVPHLLGRAAPVREIASLGVRVVEDCAMALGTRLGPRPLGSLGNVAILSFYATKLLATGQGGMLVSRDHRLLARARDLIRYDEREEYRVRYNYPMTDLAAAIGRVQLRRLPRFVTRRRALADRYERAFAGLRGASFVPHGPADACYRFVLSVAHGRSALFRSLARRGIEAKPPVYRPLHRYLGLPVPDFPGAEACAGTFVSLPIYPTLTHQDQDRVIEAVLNHFGRAR